MISWFERHNRLSWEITIFIAICIFYLSSLSFRGLPAGEESINLLATIYHFFAFFFLTLFLLISLLKGKENFLFFILAVSLAMVYGISDEIHQFFVPGRFCKLLDFCFDLAGILFAFMIYIISIKYRKVCIS